MDLATTSAAFTAKVASWTNGASGDGRRRPLVALLKEQESEYKRNITEQL